VAFFYSHDRGGEHPERHLAGFAGLLQADAYAGFNRLYDRKRDPGPILEAACWSHARRKLFELAAVSKAPIAAEAVQRIDQLFKIECLINGKPAEERLAVRDERAKPLVIELEAWLRGDGQECRVRAMTMGREGPPHGTTQSAGDPGRELGAAAGAP